MFWYFLVPLYLWTMLAHARPDPITLLEEFSPSGEQFAVAVSINQYADPSSTATLEGPRNDMDALCRLLIDRYAFPPQQVLRLHGPNATRAAVLEALHALTERASPGKQLVFAFSGHGSRLLDTETEEPDAMDETLCPYDRTSNTSGDITDDQLHYYFLDILKRGAWLTVILDACHSGSAAKQIHASRARFASPLQNHGSQLKHGPITISQNLTQRFTFLAAASEDQQALERFYPKGPMTAGTYGAFSHALLQTLEKTNGLETWEDIFHEAANIMQEHQDFQQPIIRFGANTIPFGTSKSCRQFQFRISRVGDNGLNIWRVEPNTHDSGARTVQEPAESPAQQ